MKRIMVALFANNLLHKLIVIVLTSEHTHRHARLIDKLDTDKSQVFRESSGTEKVSIIYNFPELPVRPEACWITRGHASVLCECH